MSLPLLFAHRGASHDMPENTMAAFELAWDQQADGVEMDVHLSKDNRIVAIHDEDTKRTTGIPGKVRETLFADLQTLDAGRLKRVPPTAQRIPLLDDVLAALPENRLALVEIKCGAGVIPVLQDILPPTHPARQRVRLQSFDFDTIASAKRAFPDLPAFWLVEDRHTDWSPLLDKAERSDLDGINPARSRLVTPDFVEAAHRRGMKTFVWTVDEPEVARCLAERGVDGIITNRPGLLRQSLLGRPGSISGRKVGQATS